MSENGHLDTIVHSQCQRERRILPSYPRTTDITTFIDRTLICPSYYFGLFVLSLCFLESLYFSLDDNTLSYTKEQEVRPNLPQERYVSLFVGLCPTKRKDGRRLSGDTSSCVTYDRNGVDSCE